MLSNHLRKQQSADKINAEEIRRTIVYHFMAIFLALIICSDYSFILAMFQSVSRIQRIFIVITILQTVHVDLLTVYYILVHVYIIYYH